MTIFLSTDAPDIKKGLLPQEFTKFSSHQILVKQAYLFDARVHFTYIEERLEKRQAGKFPACRGGGGGTLLVQRSAHAQTVSAIAATVLHGFRRATCNIGLSSLTGGNDFGLFVAHGIDFYLFGFMELRPKASFPQD